MRVCNSFVSVYLRQGDTVLSVNRQMCTSSNWSELLTSGSQDEMLTLVLLTPDASKSHTANGQQMVRQTSRFGSGVLE